MLTKNCVKEKCGASLIDVLAMLAFSVLFIALMISIANSSRNRHGNYAVTKCRSNLKQVYLSFALFAHDHDGLYPMQLSTNSGGSMEHVGTGRTLEHFRALSNELNVPKIILCRSDTDRIEAFDFGATFNSNSNVSYFVNLDARDTGRAPSQRFLSGDRLLAIDGRQISGIHRLTNGGRFAWRKDVGHGNGNILFEDGSVHQLDTRALRAALIRSGTAMNRLSIPD